MGFQSYKTGAHIGIHSRSEKNDAREELKDAKRESGPNTNSFDIGSVLPSLVGAVVGTTGTLVVSFVRSWWREPDVKVRYDPENVPYRQITPNPLDEDKDNKTLWIRFVLQNEGRTTAKGLEVKLVSIKDMNRGGKEIEEFFPVTLGCLSGGRANDFDLKKDETGIIGLVYKNSVSPAQFKISTVNDGHPKVGLLTYEEGHYLLEVKIYGTGMDSITKKFEVVSGKEFGDLRVEMNAEPVPWYKRVYRALF